MSERQPLTTWQLTRRLLLDLAMLTVGFLSLAEDVAARRGGWAVADIVYLAFVGSMAAIDIHNWKDPSPRFTPVRRLPRKPGS
jgi:hypothetical protein